ncbi:MAG: hypothetical protein Q4D44_05170 [Eubacteriales bacterium]|nr:hypothetical protein [Eubacteriales bacterium]
MIYDLIFLLIIVVFGVIGYFRKASKALVGILVFLVSVGLSVYLSNLLSDIIYDSVVEPWIISAVSDRIAEAASVGTKDLSQSALSAIPGVLLVLLGLLGFDSTKFNLDAESLIDESSAKIAEVCADVLRAPFISLISLFLGILFFVILISLLSYLSKFILNVFKLPLIDTVDSVAGAVLGVLEGCGVSLLTAAVLSFILPFIISDVWFFTEDCYGSSLVLQGIFDLHLFS